MAEQIRYDHYLHGGDYNPEQWLDRPDILKKDIEYFKKAHINTVSMGMFSWAVLEPEERRMIRLNPSYVLIINCRRRIRGFLILNY